MQHEASRRARTGAPSVERCHGPAVRAVTLDPDTAFRRYAPMMLRRVRCFYRGPDAEEVLQEIFLKLVERPGLFDGRSSPVTWLYRVTTNHCITRLRNSRRRLEILEEHAPDFQPPSEEGRQEQRAFLRQMFADIDEELAQIGVYYYVDGMTHAEIARVADCSARTVGNRLDTLQSLLQARLRRERTP